MSSSANLVPLLEELSANAWPAAIMQAIDGWRLRFNWGVTRRANSVWPNATENRRSLAEKLSLVEDFYSRWGQSARYQICPAAQPSELDKVLAKRGYTSDAQTSVQIAPLATVLANTIASPSYTITTADTFDEEWFVTYCALERVNSHTAEVRRGILQRIGPLAGYALLKLEGQPIALGLAVVERGWSGVFSMVTHIDFRQQGAATAVLRALANWSQSHQASHMYLQVMLSNAPARALYARTGFKTLYHYHYREAS
jgi:ribosomal protein S18 acetylase RimI-like enzyme